MRTICLPMNLRCYASGVVLLHDSALSECAAVPWSNSLLTTSFGLPRWGTVHMLWHSQMLQPHHSCLIPDVATEVRDLIEICWDTSMQQLTLFCMEIDALEHSTNPFWDFHTLVVVNHQDDSTTAAAITSLNLQVFLLSTTD